MLMLSVFLMASAVDGSKDSVQVSASQFILIVPMFCVSNRKKIRAIMILNSRGTLSCCACNYCQDEVCKGVLGIFVITLNLTQQVGLWRSFSVSWRTQHKTAICWTSVKRFIIRNAVVRTFAAHQHRRTKCFTCSWGLLLTRWWICMFNALEVSNERVNNCDPDKVFTRAPLC